MKNIALVVSILLTFGGGCAFAKNSHGAAAMHGHLPAHRQHTVKPSVEVDPRTKSIDAVPARTTATFHDGSAHRFGDASPSSYSY